MTSAGEDKQNHSKFTQETPKTEDSHLTNSTITIGKIKETPQLISTLL